MIVPMKHVTALCMAKDKNAALEMLAGLGLLHVSVEVRDSVDIVGAALLLESVRRAKACVEEACASKPEALSLRPPVNAPETGVPEFVSEINSLADRYIAAREDFAAYGNLVRKYAGWGNFDPRQLTHLRESGIMISIFKVPASFDVNSVPPDAFLTVNAGSGGELFCVIVGAAAPDCPGIVEMPLPEKPLSEFERLESEARDAMVSLARELAAHKSDLVRLSGEILRLGAYGEYVLVRDNMPQSGAVAHIAGFIPARDAETFVKTASDNGLGVSIRDPEPEENPPTLLEPPKLFRPITAMFRALGITPGYSESDVSVPFYAFFSLFFAMLIGDAGYGALIFAATLLVKHRVFRAGKPVSAFTKSCFSLMAVFSGCTIVYGILSGTYFGIPHSALPAFLKFGSVAWLGDQDNIMQLCFTIGVIHLSIARLWNAVLLYPSTKALAELGWVGVLCSMYCIICSIVISGFVMPAWIPWFMGVSVLLILLFMLNVSELKGNAASLGMLPLNIISSMGDIISYVRLFAVGLASVKVAENFNLMAVGLDLPVYVKLPAMVLILFLGHAMNFALCALSILVHAVRLNTLEFSGAKGVTWSGEPFRPFAIRAADAGAKNR